MSNKTPLFPMPDPQHFSDYGFDPQINYFQVLQEPKHKPKIWSWKNALSFFKLKWINVENDTMHDVHAGRARACSLSGPVYITESRSGSSTPCRTTSRPVSGPLAGSLTPRPRRKCDVGVPYLSLRELNMEDMHQQQKQRVSTSAMPIYLVT